MYKAKGPGGLVKRRSGKAAEARAAAAAAGGGAQPHQKGEAGQGYASSARIVPLTHLKAVAGYPPVQRQQVAACVSWWLTAVLAVIGSAASVKAARVSFIILYILNSTCIKNNNGFSWLHR